MFTGACQQIACMVKQLNYVWLTAEIAFIVFCVDGSKGSAAL